MVTSLSNPAVKQARALRQRKQRADAGLFLVEGLHHVGEALEAGWEVESLLYAPELLVSEFGNALIERAAGLPVKVQAVSAQVMESLAEKDNPQGLLAVVRQRRQDLEALPSTMPVVALVSPQDPGNVGAILRTIDAAGAGGLLLLDSNLDIYHPTMVRASMGSLFWKPIVQTSFQEFQTWAGKAGRQVVGTSAHAAQDYRGFSARAPWALVMGSEQKGLSAEQLETCDAALALPMRGRVSSLNLAVATGILLYALIK
jgi:TrmH family RNA methyltransferase